MPRCSSSRASFNPRPSLLTSESRVLLDNLRQDRAFQSTPVIADERIVHPQVPRGIDRRFNPRPSLLTSESNTVDGGGLDVQRFNPRPSLLTSESLEGTLDQGDEGVSIHARHC